MSNEAADRLVDVLVADAGMSSQGAADSMENALRIERRATVERIRAEISKRPNSGGLTWTMNVILNEEAAR